MFYFIGLIRFTKMRYMIILICGHILFLCVLIVNYIGTASNIYSRAWSNCGTAYQVLLFLLAALFFMGNVIEILIKREVIVKQLKSIYSRFIKCEKLEDSVIVSKYD